MRTPVEDPEELVPRLRGAASRQGKHGRPTYDQAKRIIVKFGGEAKVASLLGISRVTVYRWQYGRPYGLDGLIPIHWVDKLQRAARTEGIFLTADDWLPTRINYYAEDTPTPDLISILEPLA